MLLIIIEEATMMALIVNLVIYIVLSAWILISKHNKIKKASATQSGYDLFVPFMCTVCTPECGT